MKVCVPLLSAKAFCASIVVFFCMTIFAQHDVTETVPALVPTSHLAAQAVSSHLQRGVLDDIYGPTPVVPDQQDDHARTSVFNEFFAQFIREKYNNAEFAPALSHDPYYMVRLLTLCNELNLDAQMAYVCTRLFYNKIKACEVMDDTVVYTLLVQLPPLLEQYCVVQEAPTQDSLAFIKKHVHATILTHLVDHVLMLPTEPERFVDDLTQQVTSVLAHEYQDQRRHQEESASRARLANMTVRFFDLALGKTSWDVYHPETLWPSFVQMSRALAMLVQHGVIQHSDEIDDLLWTHLHRFMYVVLELSAELLPEKFFEQVETAIADGEVYFFDIEEQDEHITPKKEVFLSALLRAKIRMYAQRMGISAQALSQSVSESMPHTGQIKHKMAPETSPVVDTMVRA